MPRPPIFPRVRHLALVLPVLLVLAASLLAAADRVDLEGLDGGRLTTADLESGRVVLVVWASWSPRCREIADQVDALARSWSSRARVVTVVFQEESAAVRTFLAGRKLAAPTYLDSDGAFSKQHAVTTLPGLLVFRDGVVTYRGKLPADPDPVISQALE